jgi:hypothetical protein
MERVICNSVRREPWNKGKLVGQKAPLKLKDIWAIRVRLQLSAHARDLALFNLAIDSKLRACDLVKLRVRDVSQGERIATRLRSPSTRARRWPLGSDPLTSGLKIFCFPAECASHPICPRANMHASSIDGFMTSDWIRVPMARTLCGGRRHL